MSRLANLIPLLILLIVVGGGAYIGYQIYLWSNEMTDRGKQHLEKKNMSFTKEGGLRVGVKEMKDEQYADKTQNVLVNVWNNAALPNYKSRLGWNSTQAKPASSSDGASARPSFASRTSSQQSRPDNSRTTSSTGAAMPNLAPPAAAPKKSGSPVPGAW